MAEHELLEEPVEQPASSDAGGAGRVEAREGVAWLILDLPGKKVNVLSSSLMSWFEERLQELERDPPGGVVLISGKTDTFIAGADIDELRAFQDEEEVARLLERGHALLARLGALPCPTVAAIHGVCLGGGLELALAFDWRVASEHAKTRLGLPEVQLGIFPGLGGTQRLPRLIGVPSALDLILTGRRISARKARRIGLVDETCHPADLPTAALLLVERGKAKRPKRGAQVGMTTRAADLVARSPLGGKLVYGRAREEVLRKSGGHYPGPLKALEVVREGIRMPLGEALEVEARAFVELVVTDTAKNLMQIFFMKNDVETRAARRAEAAREVAGLAVLGAGLMGAGIAQLLSYRGFQLILKDRDQRALGGGLKYCSDRFRELVRRRRYREIDLKEAMARIRPAVDYRGFERVDFVLEAVFEDLEVKRQVVREVEEVAPEELIFASNTSTIPIATLAEASRRPDRMVGMHFFSPVHRMPLVEVIRHPETSESTVATAVELARRMGKTVIVVEDGPGFFTSRVLGPYLNEAAWCLAQGAKVEEVDRALTRWGWPVGPLALLDEVGLDIVRHAASVLRDHFGGRLEPPPVMERMIDDGRLGRKSGSGFYRYDRRRKRVDESVYGLLEWRQGSIPEDEIAERCWLQMLNEVARALEDGVIRDPVDVDIGVIFGLGFPPFRGGILRHADRVGLSHAVERLEHYAAEQGSRFEPAALLRDMAKKGERFHAS